MNDIFADLGLTEPEPDTSLYLFLVAHPEFREVCKKHGWWATTIEEIEGETVAGGTSDS